MLQVSMPCPRAKKTGSILVVEDDWFLSQLIVQPLRDRRYKVIEARDADQAFVFLRSDQIKVLFTDIGLPDGSMDGLALAKLAREIRPDIKVVVASGQDRPKNIWKLADHWFSKPYDTDRAVLIVEDLFGDGRMSEYDRALMPKIGWETAID
jgi:DNA-binding NtrC family response regulator